MPKSPCYTRHHVSRQRHRPPKTSIGPGIHEYFETNPCFEENHLAYMDALRWINDLNIRFQEISRKKQESEAVLFDRIKGYKADISKNNETISNLERKLAESKRTISILKKRARTSITTGGARNFGESKPDLEGISYIFPEEDDIHFYESFHEDNLPNVEFLNNKMSSEDFQVNENNLRSDENRMLRNARTLLHDRKLGREFVDVKRLHMPEQNELIGRPNSTENVSQSVNVISETVSESSYEPSSPSMTFGCRRQKPNELISCPSFNVDMLQENNPNIQQEVNQNIFELSIREVSYTSELNPSIELTAPEPHLPYSDDACFSNSNSMIEDELANSNPSPGAASVLNTDDSIEIQELNANDLPQPQPQNSATVENEGDGDHVNIPADDDQHQVNILEYSLMQSSETLLSSFSFRDNGSSDLEWKPYDLQNGDESAFKIITVDVQYGRKPPIKKCYVAQLQEEMTYFNGTNLEKIYHVVYYRRKEQKIKGTVKTVFVKPLLRKFFVCECSDVIFGLPAPTEARRGGLIFTFDFEPFNIPKF